MNAIESLPRATRSIGQLKLDVDQYGYCLIEGALDSVGVKAVRDRLDAQATAEQRHGYHQRSQVQDPGGVNQWVYMLLNKGEAFKRLLFNPLVSGVVEHLLGPEFLLSDISAHITWPGNSLLPLHIDQWWMPPLMVPGESYVRAGAVSRENVATVEGLPPTSSRPIHPPVVVNAMWMISDYTEENGATRLVPRSHLCGAQPAPTVPHHVPSVPAIGRAGTVILWDGRTWHSAGANTSRAPRFGITTYYCGPQFRSLQNHTLGTKPEVLRDASPELLALLGFKPFGSYGHTGNRESAYAQPADQLIGELNP